MIEIRSTENIMITTIDPAKVDNAHTMKLNITFGLR